MPRELIEGYKMKIPAGMRLKDKSPCAGLRADLKMCVLETDCVKIDKILPRKCVQDGRVPDMCMVLHDQLFECKRQLVDMRTRLRGRKGY